MIRLCEKGEALPVKDKAHGEDRQGLGGLCDCRNIGRFVLLSIVGFSFLCYNIVGQYVRLDAGPVSRPLVRLVADNCLPIVHMYKTMMSQSANTVALSCLLLACLAVGSAGLSEDDDRVLDLLRPPADSAEAARVRIWLPLERNTKCRVRLNITNDSGRVVRHVLDHVLGPAYYNFYWDKRDDSGRWVPAGQYRWVAEDCRDTHEGTLVASYRLWEREARLVAVDSAQPGRFNLELDSGSVAVSLVVRNKRDRLVDSIITDTILDAGRHPVEWTPPPGYAGDFYLEADIGGFTHRLDFRHPGRD